MAIPRRTVQEVITKYKLEPELKDVFVEGASDRVLLKTFFSRNFVSDCCVYEIDTIEFPDRYIPRNNKWKVLFLSHLIEKECPNSRRVSFVIDRDFDDLISFSYPYRNLLQTDFSCMEAYAFCPENLITFLDISLHGFPISIEKTIEEMSRVWREVFLVRFAGECLKQNINITPCLNIVEIKKNGEIIFDEKEYLKRVLLSNSLIRLEGIFFELINNTRPKLQNPLSCLHKNDAISLFKAYINRIKSQMRIDEEHLRKSLILAIDFVAIRRHPMFSKLYIICMEENGTLVA